MLSNREKATLITELSAHNKESTCQTLLALLDILIADTRLDNDSAPADTVRVNQGKIQAYAGLKDMIERGLPGIKGQV